MIGEIAKALDVTDAAVAWFDADVRLRDCVHECAIGLNMPDYTLRREARELAATESREAFERLILAIEEFKRG